ncbi:CpeT/CpcT family (DUF1001) [Rubidibacter lacunae KORDI 51-2]|uniref:CpeT/CpcT family (DUF1001) n=1 Tax=Rubidibacter lacunae KORDI 51-2 TaxID=582515 RepID=U5DBQ3_9CHRO|nr:chromophore lyase CpcT/CpeT [Rubidibacter lacunae]ERN41963.1 CpeT/CpcT family (DUF1001) [Rubidibacter lacunae KORDI 51-2]
MRNQTSIVASGDVTGADVIALSELLIGCFDSSEQAAADPDFALVRYENCALDLVNCTTADADTRYIYAEQTANTPTVQFARRRIMQVRPAANDRQLEVAFYTLADESRWASFCSRDGARSLMPEDLGPYECSLFFQWLGDRFAGGTPAGGCAHQYRGAARLTIAAELSTTELNVWERWYDASGRQVAGPVSGPYRYKPVKS